MATYHGGKVAQKSSTIRWFENPGKGTGGAIHAGWAIFIASSAG
jgi:hypothetical protein